MHSYPDENQSFDILAGENDEPGVVPLRVSVSKSAIGGTMEECTYEELKYYADESNISHKFSNELTSMLNCTGSVQLDNLKKTVDRTVKDAEYRNALARDSYVIENLIQVLKQTTVRLEPIYSQMSMSVDALRMDIGSVDETHQKRLYVTKWALILRIMNIIKNLLVSNVGIQDQLLQQKVLLEIVKLIPKAMVAREIAIHQGCTLVGDAESFNSTDICRDFVRVSIPICSKADSTMITFLLNSIGGSNKMQTFLRPQLWSGPMAVLGLTVACSKSRSSSVSRFSKDLSHFILLFHTLFQDVAEIELADWWELEDSQLWVPRGELRHGRTTAENRAIISNSLQRTATNLSMQLTIPGWSGGVSQSESPSKNLGEAHRADTVIGALMEPQTSSVQGKGVVVDRMKSFKVINNTSGGTGSLGFSGRESLLIVLTSISAGLKTIEAENLEDSEAHRIWELLIESMDRKGGFSFWHAFLQSFKKCRAISRLLKAVSINKTGPLNPISFGVDDHQDESIYHLMSESIVGKLRTMFDKLDLIYPKSMNLQHIEDVLLYNSEDMNSSLIRSCIGDIYVNEVILKSLMSNDEKKRQLVVQYLMDPSEDRSEIARITNIMIGLETSDNIRLYSAIKEYLDRQFANSANYKALNDHIASVAESHDMSDNACNLSSGSAMRIVSQLFPHIPAGEFLNKMIEDALRTAFRWLKTMQHILHIELEAVQALKKEQPDAKSKIASIGEMRQFLVSHCGLTATLCLETLTSIFAVAMKTPETREVASRVCIETRGLEAVLTCTTILSEDEPTIRERATLALAGITSVTNDVDSIN